MCIRDSPRSVSQSGCLLAIKQHLGNLIDKWNPDEMAVERIIYVQSHQTAITMGAAKAAVVICSMQIVSRGKRVAKSR